MSILVTDKTRSIKLILWRGSLVLIVIFIWVSPSLRSIIIFEKSLFRLQLTISRKMIFGHIIICRNKVYLSGGITIALLYHECILSSSLLHMNVCDQNLQGCLILFVPQSLLELPPRLWLFINYANYHQIISNLEISNTLIWFLLCMLHVSESP